MQIRTTWMSRLNYLTNQTNRIGGDLAQINQKVSTGLEIERPSDAPEVVSRLHALNREIADQKQYAKDGGYATNLLDVADSVLNDLAGVLSDARVLAVQMGSDTYEGPMRVASSEQADQLLQQAIDLMNTHVADRYLFGGQAYDRRPYADDLSYQGSDTASLISVADGVDVIAGFVGEDMRFGDVLRSIEGLREALKTDNAVNVRTALDALVSASDFISTSQTTLGVEQRTALDFTEMADSMGLELEVQRSAIQDSDTLEAVMRLGQLQTQYEASLAVTAKAQLGTLFDRI